MSTSLRIRTLAAAAVLAVVTGSAAGAQTVAIVGGTVYPVSGPKIERGTVLIRDGRIVAVGANVAVPAGATLLFGHIVCTGCPIACMKNGSLSIAGGLAAK